MPSLNHGGNYALEDNFFGTQKSHENNPWNQNMQTSLKQTQSTFSNQNTYI